MWAARYFASAYWADRYWAKVGAQGFLVLVWVDSAVAGAGLVTEGVIVAQFAGEAIAAPTVSSAVPTMTGEALTIPGLTQERMI
jgi:hypothetical protein